MARVKDRMLNRGHADPGATLWPTAKLTPLAEYSSVLRAPAPRARAARSRVACPSSATAERGAHSSTTVAATASPLRISGLLRSDVRPEPIELRRDRVGALELPPVRAAGQADEAGAGAVGQSRTEAGRRVGIALAPEHEPGGGHAREIAGPFATHVHRRSIEGEDATLHGGIDARRGVRRVGRRHSG